MKLKRATLILGLIAVLAMTGCGSKDKNETADTQTSSEADTESMEDEAELLALPLVERDDWKVEDCVELGEYKGLKADLTYDAATDDDVEAYLKSLATAREVTDEDAVVESGDVVNLAFEGKLDGAAFEGGTSDSYDLTIGSGQFIDGFEDGMIGMKIGETKDLNLTFPENYGSTDLAGKDVVFTVTVHSISRAAVDDQWVSEYTEGEYTSLEKYRPVAEEELNNNRKNAAMTGVKSELWTQLVNNSKVLQLPKNLVENARSEMEAQTESGAASNGITKEEYVQNAYGYDMETYESRLELYCRTVAKNELVLMALQAAEKLTSDSDEYKEELQKLADTYASTPEDMIENYGQEMVDEYIYSNLGMERLLANAEITETVN